MAAQSTEDPITISEIEEIAQSRLPPGVWDFYSLGADELRALKNNLEAYNQLHILPRVLRDVSNVDTSTNIMGQPWPLPLMLAPSSMQKLAGGEGELDTARAAGKFGVNMVLSSAATSSMNDVIENGQAMKAEDSRFSSDFWFQLYLTADEARTDRLIRRAEDAGYKALVITVDTPVLGNRINERRAPLVTPSYLKLPNVEGVVDPNAASRPPINRSLMDARTAKQAADLRREAGKQMHSASVTWADIETLRKKTSMKIILKGIMTPEDAGLAVKHGADALIISNHGGRQFDCTIGTIEALPAIADVVKRRIPVLIDGGIRRGSDVVKAVALGADAVLIGRPVLWGLAYSGQNGVETVLNIFEREISRAMALAGVSRVDQLDRSYLGVRTGGFGVAKL